MCYSKKSQRLKIYDNFCIKYLELIEKAFLGTKLIKHFAKKSLCVFSGALLNAFIHTKTLFGKMFY